MILSSNSPITSAPSLFCLTQTCVLADVSFHPGLIALLAKFITTLTADMMTSLWFLYKILAFLALYQMEILLQKLCLVIFTFSWMSLGKTFRTNLKATCFALVNVWTGINVDDSFAFLFGTQSFGSIWFMDLKESMYFEVLFPLFQGHLIAIKWTFLVEISFTILIRARNLLKHPDLVLNVTLCASRAKLMTAVKYFLLFFIFTYLTLTYPAYGLRVCMGLVVNGLGCVL